MRAVDLIQKKRDGQTLSDDEIQFLIEGYTKGDIPDYQMSAFTMAVYFRKMNEAETLTLTKAMVQSGDTLDLSAIDGIKVDKHSTGGVGDKTSLSLLPLLAS
ncbi:MAG: pyrimidine-nucleoside phosphorylase, partial [Lachnospiraceae bacterium]|nr:pyrimidine-nucleoside phosphorylase [Lachnospiraceae bacterium]